MKDMSKMTPKEQYSYRCQLYRDAMSFRKPDRIPFCANVFNWMFLDAGYQTAVAARDYDIIEKCMAHFVENYKADAINCLSSGFRNNFRITDALGGSGTYTDGQEESENLNAIVEDFLRPEELEEFVKDPVRKNWELFFRRYPHASEMSPKELAEATKTLDEFNQARVNANQRLHDYYGILAENDVPNFYPGIEHSVLGYRGLRGTSISLRRHKKQLKEFCQVLDDGCYAQFEQWLDSVPDGPNMNETFDMSIPFLAHVILNNKQFDEYYAPIYTKMIQKAIEKKKQIIVWAEGSWLRFADFFNQFPKGSLTIMVEMDDIYEAREKCPNLCLMGGLDRDLLSAGTPDECIAAAKRVIDDLGRDGGLILQPSKMIAYANDCKAENLKAVCDFVSTYEI